MTIKTVSSKIGSHQTIVPYVLTFLNSWLFVLWMVFLMRCRVADHNAALIKETTVAHHHWDLNEEIHSLQMAMLAFGKKVAELS